MYEGAWWGGAELCTVHSLLNPPTCVPDSPTPLSTLTPPSSPTQALGDRGAEARRAEEGAAAADRRLAEVRGGEQGGEGL